MEGMWEDNPSLLTRIKPLIYVLAAILLMVLGVVLLYRGSSIMITSLYDNKNNRIEFVCSGNEVCHIEDGESNPVTVKAISVKPGDEAYCGSWENVLDLVVSAGGNTVLAQDVLAPEFYKALKQYNETHGNDVLYLLQRVRLGDEAYEGMADLISGNAAGKLLNRGKYAVDVLHGCRIFQGYSADVSAFAIGFVIGDEWDPGLLTATNHKYQAKPYEYLGIYYTCTSSFIPVEAHIVRTMDALISYEIGKYDHRTPLGIWNATKTDDVFHVPAYLHDYGAIATFIQSHMSTTDDCQVGTFACYDLEDESYPMIATDTRYAKEVESGNASSVYEAYVSDTVMNAEGPVIVYTEASSARGALGSSEGYGKLLGASDGQGQGLRYQQLINDAFTGGAAGFSLPLVDNVYATSWNTEYVSEDNGLWRNQQNPNQYCGVMAVADEVTWSVDGDDTEWKDVSPTCSVDGGSLKAAYDSEYLYLCVETSAFDRTRDNMTIAFDVTPKSGSESFEGRLTFDRNVDFVLNLSKNRTELLVQRYYNYFWAQQMLAHLEMEQPIRNMDAFGTIYQYTRQHDYATDGVESTEIKSDYYATGGFASGHDYVVGERCVELRIPWALLNFFDPSTKTILGDYYVVRDPNERLLDVDALYMGLSLDANDSSIHLSEFALSGWTDVTWTAQEKPSLALVREAFSAH